MTTVNSAMADDKKRKKVHPLLISGKHVKFRRSQQLIWTVLAGLLGVGFIAGLYWLILQQHYPFMPGSGSLKLFWDNGLNGLIRSPEWANYRHGIRDNGEPEFWAMIGAMLVMGFSLGIATTMSLTNVVDLASPAAMGTVMSLRITGNRIGQVAVPFVASLIAAATGVAGIFVIIALSLTASGAAVHFSRREM